MGESDTNFELGEGPHKGFFLEKSDKRPTMGGPHRIFSDFLGESLTQGFLWEGPTKDFPWESLTQGLLQ